MAQSERVVVAMSGGVDSSLAAALLVEQGYQVVGIMLRLWAEEENRCCTPQALEDARQVAACLQIPFYLVNLEAEFRERVVDHFLAEYARGRTPNPCLACNRHVRFGRLLQHAGALDAGHVATGHYARVRTQDGEYQLLMGADRNKDQSYVLYMLGQQQLAQVLFPVGGYTKLQVREMARARGLPVADRDESMDLCFVSGDYRQFIRKHAPGAFEPGPVLDPSGRVLGQHQGLAFHTVGQRRGLGIAAAEPLYVVHLDPARNAITVGTTREMGHSSLVAEDVLYVRGSPPAGPARIQAKIRYRAEPIAATWKPQGQARALVDLDLPARDITPGQAIVAYQGEVVLGGGIIAS